MLVIFLSLVLFVVCGFFGYFFSLAFGNIHHAHLVAVGIIAFFYLLLGGLAALQNDEKQKYNAVGSGFSGLIVGGVLMATYISTGTYLVEGDLAYQGLFPMLILALVMVGGYFLGNAFLARYIYRSGRRTLIEYCRERFCSESVGRVFFIMHIILVMAYMASITLSLGSGVGYMTGLNYVLCGSAILFFVMLVVLITGNRGLAIVEACMGMFIVIGSIIGIGLFVQGVGGGSWNGAFAKLLSSEYHDLATWKGGSFLYASVGKRYFWGVYMSLLLTSLTMAAPWQIRGYVIAGNEREMTKSVFLAAIMAFIAWFFGMADGLFLRGTPVSDLPQMTSVMVNYPAKYMPIWAGMLILTTIVSAGISSMAVFLGQISEGIAGRLFIKSDMSGKQKTRIGRLTMIATTFVVWLTVLVVKQLTMRNTLLATLEISASSIVPVLLASVWSKKLTKQGALVGALAGFIVSLELCIFYAVTKTVPYLWLMPAYVGAGANVLLMWLVSRNTQVTEEEKAFREAMFVLPEEEKTAKHMKTNLRWAKAAILLGPLATIFLTVLWAYPIYQATH